MDDSCNESRCINQFQSLSPTVDNVAYDINVCDKNDLLRKFNEVLSGTIPIPVNIEIDEDKLFAKIQAQNSGSAPPQVNKEQEELPPPEYDPNEIVMDPAPVEGSGIQLEKREMPQDDFQMEEIPLEDEKPSGISLAKRDSNISLEKSENKSGGISLDKRESSEDSPPSGISLEKRE